MIRKRISPRESPTASSTKRNPNAETNDSSKAQRAAIVAEMNRRLFGGSKKLLALVEHGTNASLWTGDNFRTDFYDLGPVEP